MGELKSSGKPFDISKREVWEAYEKVKANKGAPGVDGCSIDEFVGDQLIPHVFAHMIRRFPWGTTVAAAAGYLGTTVGTPASPSAAR